MTTSPVWRCGISRSLQRDAGPHPPKPVRRDRRDRATPTRRDLLGLPLALRMAGGIVNASAGDDDLAYRDGRLSWRDGSARAAVGRAGIVRHKAEGDGATPAGTFPLLRAFYRADRIAPPRTRLPVRALAPADAWVDDPGDLNYNRLVANPYPRHTETLWLEDPVYDLLVVIGYNVDPVVPGAGSAIFLHVARPDFAPTAGCIAVEKPVLLRLLPGLGPASTIAIHG